MYRLIIQAHGQLEEDITDRVIRGGLGKISKKIESSDFVIGNFVYNSMRIKLVNADGEFSLGGKYFPLGADATRIKVQYVGQNGLVTTAFRGIVEESAIKEDERRYVVNILCISTDSTIRKTLIPAGEIPDGMGFRDAIFTIINRSPINELIGVDLRNISLGFDGVIESGDYFSLRSAREGVNRLLIAGSAFAYIDSSGNYIVRPRVVSNKTPVKTFYASHDERRLTPIVLAIKQVNSGVNRVFNSVTINSINYRDQRSIDYYGLKARSSLSMPFITDEFTAFAIAENIVRDFRYSKEELQVDLLSQDVQNLEVGDIVRLDIRPYITSPTDSNGRGDLLGQAVFGEAKMGYGKGITIIKQLVWTIYEKMEHPEKLTATLKLRKYGRGIGDEVVPLDVYGEAIYGENRYSDDGLRYGDATYDSSSFYE